MLPHAVEIDEMQSSITVDEKISRMGRLEEVTGIYTFLASGAASFITGQEICVDGGLTAGLGNPLLGAVGAGG